MLDGLQIERVLLNIPEERRHVTTWPMYQVTSKTTSQFVSTHSAITQTLRLVLGQKITNYIANNNHQVSIFLKLRVG